MAGILNACMNPKGGGDTLAASSGEKKTFSLAEQWRTDTILEIPESVLYDPEGKLLYVSCIANRENPEDAGYIARVDLQGNILVQKWVTGISFPKGLAKIGDKLFVTELNSIVEIDIPSAEITKRITIDSAIFLNDLTTDPKGNLYASDTRGNAIYKISDGAPSLLLAEKNPGPNGLLFEEERLLMTSNGKEAFLMMDHDSKELAILADSILRGDGIAYAGIPGHYLVSRWPGQVFMVYPDNSKATLLYTEDKSIQTADIAFATDLELLFVPTFFGNNVVAYKLVADSN
jgi:sugar lactone lactonase YvrE